jgi:hypothetical protein
MSVAKASPTLVKPDDGDTPFVGMFSPFSVVNNQLVSAEFYRKHNRVAFAWV